MYRFVTCKDNGHIDIGAICYCCFFVFFASVETKITAGNFLICPWKEQKQHLLAEDTDCFYGCLQAGSSDSVLEYLVWNIWELKNHLCVAVQQKQLQLF